MILKLLAEINEDAFPIRIVPTSSVTEGVTGFAYDRENMLTLDGLSEMYGRCGDMLQIGNLKSLLRGQPQPYFIEHLAGWINSITRLLSMHILPLPEFQRAILCVMSNPPDGTVHVTFSRLEKSEPWPPVESDRPEE